MIALAGPASNMVLSLFFYVGSITLSGLASSICGFGFEINSWLAFFNMLPVGGFDGRKVYMWNKPVFALFAVLCFFTAFML